MSKKEKIEPEIQEEEILNDEASVDDVSNEEENPEDVVEEKSEEILEKIVKEDEEILSRLMRLQADFENFKKRTQKEKTEIYQFAAENFATKLLPVMDNLERAEAALEGMDAEGKTYIDGIQMVFNQLKDVLKEEGLEEVDCEGAFDPNFHHGVAVGESEEKADQDILEVFQKGYRFKEKVIRPAMVKVCNK
ncbi:MAG: nucleotide exchange factor GrpE [Eubacteriaceae bacterium]